MSRKVSIEFMEQEYQALVEMIQIADWVINADDDNGNVGGKDVYRDVRNSVLSYAMEMGMDDRFEYNVDHNEYYELREYDESGPHRKFIDEYDSQTFWEQLIDRLSERDLASPLDSQSSNGVPGQNQNERLLRIRMKYEQEFEENGIKNIRVQPPT